MLYSELIRLAMQIAYQAHQGQTDKGGYPYIHHPMHLAEQMETETETIVALLHDVAEDTPVTLQQLRELGIPEAAVRSLALLCHDDDTPYLDYIDRMRGDLTALKVKRADLLHNSDQTRVPAGTDLSYYQARYRAALERVERYIRELEKNSGENQKN